LAYFSEKTNNLMVAMKIHTDFSVSSPEMLFELFPTRFLKMASKLKPKHCDRMAIISLPSTLSTTETDWKWLDRAREREREREKWTTRVRLYGREGEKGKSVSICSSMQSTWRCSGALGDVLKAAVRNASFLSPHS